VYRRPPESPVGGIPVDSEYIIFIIDTSGSMQRFAWPLVRQKMAQVLDAYPKVKGLQIMNDEGVYMFSRYSGKWIPETGERKVRIHAIGFPTVFSQARYGENTGVRFATLMRLLCERNGGAFVALNSLTP
jgi:hypothetical protein